MRCIIMISEEPEQYLACSTTCTNPPKKIHFTPDLDKAEVWIDPEAARAWCLQHDQEEATILQLDAPVRIKPAEIRRIEPEARTMTSAEKTAVRTKKEAKQAKAAEKVEEG